LANSALPLTSSFIAEFSYLSLLFTTLFFNSTFSSSCLSNCSIARYLFLNRITNINLDIASPAAGTPLPLVASILFGIQHSTFLQVELIQ